MNMGEMMNMPIGVIEARCNNKACEAPDAPLRLRAVMVKSKDRPQNLVPAIQLLATKHPPLVKNEAGALVRNPEFSPTDVTPIATWEIVEEFCNNKDCYDAIMDRLWRLGQERLKVLWGKS